ncbi:MAG: 50S ribosomal protein L1 [Candidatus Thermoplasmatota archaeon]|nr:50S ribosomal protein L1 [Candidatus Thermoplasmatota archaeon]
MAEEKIIKAVTEALQKAPERKFQESVELAINLKDVDLANPKNRITDEVILPKGRGKAVKVGLFGSPEMVTKAKGVADLIIGAEEVAKMAEDKSETKKKVNGIDFFVAEAPLMAVVGKNLGVILGPRGKMPRPLPPGSDPAIIIANLRKTVKVRSKDRRTFHVPVGTRDMTPSDISANIESVLNRIKSKLERGYMNIHSVYVKTSMGPAVRIDLR